MSDGLPVEFFLEDNAHRQIILPLVERVAREEGVRLRFRVRNATGGHGRAVTSYKRYQTLRARGVGGATAPALLVVGIDGNCSRFAAARGRIREATRPAFVHSLVVACPDPHIERWYMADPEAFQSVVGSRPHLGTAKCERDHYKRLLANAVRRAGHTPTLGGAEFGEELAETMDLFRAGKNDSSFKAFIGDLREVLRGASRAARL